MNAQPEAQAVQSIQTVQTVQAMQSATALPALNGQAPGFTGKLAAVGDFVHRRLPTAVNSRLDEWLSLGLAHGRQRLGADWLPRYLTAPLWAFAWAPQVVSDRAWAGVLMPSVDAVGRYFPLLVAQALDASPKPAALDGAATAPFPTLAWYHGLGLCALATLGSTCSLQDFEAGLGQLQAHSASTVGDDQVPTRAGSNHWSPTPALASSLWWPLDLHDNGLTSGLTSGVTPSLGPSPSPTSSFTCSGLPTPEQLAAMLAYLG